MNRLGVPYRSRRSLYGRRRREAPKPPIAPEMDGFLAIAGGVALFLLAWAALVVFAS